MAGPSPGSGPRRFRRAVRAAHLWVGLAFCGVLAVLALSGSALVYKEAVWRWSHPELRGGDIAPESGEMAAAIEAAYAAFGDGLRTVKMPEPGVPAYHLYLDDGEALMTPGDLRILDRWGPRGRPMAFLFDLHAHLLAGERGEQVGGVIALTGVLLLISGLYLWWPARRRTGLRTLTPRDSSRPALIALHRDLGLYATPILLVLLLTGAGVVFYGAAGRILNGIFGDGPMAAEPAPERVELPPASPPDAALLARVADAFPAGRIVFHYPATADGPHVFRVKQACELHPNGRSYVFTDGRGEIVHREDPCAYPPGERALHTLYPLHSGKTPSGVYKALTFLGGLALTVLSASGALAYARKLQQGSGSSGATPVPTE